LFTLIKQETMNSKGKIKRLIDNLIQQRSKGDNFLVMSTKFKLLVKGIDVDKITENTNDDPDIINKIYEVAQQLNIKLA